MSNSDGDEHIIKVRIEAERLVVRFEDLIDKYLNESGGADPCFKAQAAIEASLQTMGAMILTLARLAGGNTVAIAQAVAKDMVARVEDVEARSRIE